MIVTIWKNENAAQDLNQKLYHNDFFIKPMMDNVRLISSCTASIVTLSIKEMIIRMVIHKSLFCPSMIRLYPDK